MKFQMMLTTEVNGEPFELQTECEIADRDLSDDLRVIVERICVPQIAAIIHAYHEKVAEARGFVH